MTLWKRTKGLLGRSGLADDEGLWIPTSSIHMFGMRFAIDVVYADREGRVLKLVRGIRRGGRRRAWARRSRSSSRSARSTAAGVEVGDHLVIEHT